MQPGIQELKWVYHDLDTWLHPDGEDTLSIDGPYEVNSYPTCSAVQLW